MSAPITAGTRVVCGGSTTSLGGRVGVAVYDLSTNADTVPSVIVIFADNTYDEFPRGQLAQISGGWIPGTGI